MHMIECEIKKQDRATQPDTIVWFVLVLEPEIAHNDEHQRFRCNISLFTGSGMLSPQSK